jgi:hypothetical protein
VNILDPESFDRAMAAMRAMLQKNADKKDANGVYSRLVEATEIVLRRMNAEVSSGVDGEEIAGGLVMFISSLLVTAILSQAEEDKIEAPEAIEDLLKAIYATSMAALSGEIKGTIFKVEAVEGGHA